MLCWLFYIINYILANILLLETATSVCSVGLSINGEVRHIRESFDQNSHAERITAYIAEIMSSSELDFTELDAVAVSKGPGSYTGLRIGVSTAKGICYALSIPLIAIDTLKGLAAAALLSFTNQPPSGLFLRPMIDARRMEVYTACYDLDLNLLKPTEAVILNHESFNTALEKINILFFGDGAAKCRDLLKDIANASFDLSIHPTVKAFGTLAERLFIEGIFEDMPYFEPFYLKDFVAGIPKIKGLHN